MYCARSDIEAIFGVAEVRTWADLDNNQVDADIASRITAAIAYGQSKINDRLRNGPHTIPFTEPPPNVIVTTCAQFAGIYMYEAKGIVDYNPDTGKPEHRHYLMKREALTTLREILAGVISLDLDDVPATAPEVVTNEDPYDG